MQTKLDLKQQRECVRDELKTLRLSWPPTESKPLRSHECKLGATAGGDVMHCGDSSAYRQLFQGSQLLLEGVDLLLLLLRIFWAAASFLQSLWKLKWKKKTSSHLSIFLWFSSRNSRLYEAAGLCRTLTVEHVVLPGFAWLPLALMRA